MGKISKYLIVMVCAAFISYFTWGETTKSKNSIFSLDTKQFHFGFGLTVTSGNLMGLIENVNLLYYKDINNYSGWTDEQKETISKLDSNMLNSLIAGYEQE